MMQAVADLSAVVGITAACDALGVARAAFYRQRPAPVRQPPARALRADGRAAVLVALHAERFRDRAPATTTRKRVFMSARITDRPSVFLVERHQDHGWDSRIHHGLVEWRQVRAEQRLQSVQDAG